MNIDPALEPLFESQSEETVNVIIGVRVGVKDMRSALGQAGLTVTGSSDFGSEVFLYGRICCRDMKKLTAIQEIEFISPDTEQRGL